MKKPYGKAVRRIGVASGNRTARSDWSTAAKLLSAVSADRRTWAHSTEYIIPETFWLDLVLHNPLSVEVELANVTVHTVHESSTDETGPSDNFVDAEVLDSLSLDPGETRTVHHTRTLLF